MACARCHFHPASGRTSAVAPGMSHPCGFVAHGLAEDPPRGSERPGNVGSVQESPAVIAPHIESETRRGQGLRPGDYLDDGPSGSAERPASRAPRTATTWSPSTPRTSAARRSGSSSSARTAAASRSCSTGTPSPAAQPRHVQDHGGAGQGHREPQRPDRHRGLQPPGVRPGPATVLLVRQPRSARLRQGRPS